MFGKTRLKSNDLQNCVSNRGRICAYTGKDCVGYDGNGTIKEIIEKCPVYHWGGYADSGDLHYNINLSHRFTNFLYLAELITDVNNAARGFIEEQNSSWEHKKNKINEALAIREEK